MHDGLNLPTVHAIRGPVTYGTVEVPDWLDSDPYRRKWWLHDDLRARHDAMVNRIAVGLDAPDALRDEMHIVAAGGFCALAAPLYDFMRPLTDAERAEIDERTRRYKRTLGYKINRLRGWWHRHWWPAHICDLEARLSDDWYD